MLKQWIDPFSYKWESFQLKASWWYEVSVIDIACYIG